MVPNSDYHEIQIKHENIWVITIDWNWLFNSNWDWVEFDIAIIKLLPQKLDLFFFCPLEWWEARRFEIIYICLISFGVSLAFWFASNSIEMWFMNSLLCSLVLFLSTKQMKPFVGFFSLNFYFMPFHLSCSVDRIKEVQHLHFKLKFQ